VHKSVSIIAKRAYLGAYDLVAEIEQIAHECMQSRVSSNLAAEINR